MSTGASSSGGQSNAAVPPSRVFGSVESFDARRDKWSLWEEKLKFFFLANGVTDDAQRKAMLLASVGMTALGYVHDLNMPTGLDDVNVTFASLIDQLRAHYGVRTTQLAARHEFSHVTQKDSQTVDEFAAALRTASLYCEFGAELDGRLRDQLLVGLRSEPIRKRIMERDHISFADALKLAADFERITREAKLGATSEASVSQVKASTKGPSHPRGYGTRQQPAANTQSSSSASSSRGGDSRRGGRGACWSCGETGHQRVDCKYAVYGFKCNECGETGHKAKVCPRRSKGAASFRNPAPRNNQKGRHVNAAQVDGDADNVSAVNTIRLARQHQQQLSVTSFSVAPVHREGASKPFNVEVSINGVPVTMALDTCADTSIASSALWRQLGEPALTSAPVIRAYGGAAVRALGQCDVDVVYEGQGKNLPLVFVESARERGLFGLPWIDAFKAVRVNNVDAEDRLAALLNEFADVFEPSTGSIKSHTAHLYFKPGAVFKMNKARPVPFAYRPLVEEELDRLVKQGVLSPVEVAEFTTTPLVVVPKPNGRVRICGDFKVSVNPHLNVQQYPMPTCDEVFQMLAGGQHFTKLDLADAYLQLELDDESRRYVVFTTHKGLFRVNRLAFGLACAPAIFQAVIEQVLAGVPQTQPYLDDIVITGATREEHFANLRCCFQRMRDAGVRLRREKCRFFEAEIEHLGHVVNGSGVAVNPEKTEAIRAAPPPKDKSALESWVCTAQYYADFIPRFATIAAPLNELRRQGVAFEWTPRCQKAFDVIKAALSAKSLRVHFDEKRPLILATDASPFGVGAVLLQEHADGLEHMVTCASRTLSAAEQRYSQIEKEALAIVYGFRRFKQFVVGREVVLVTDHKPLTFIFRPDVAVSQTASQRIQRWSLFLSGFSYTVRHRPGKSNSQADALSRSPLTSNEQYDVEVNAVQLAAIEAGPSGAIGVARVRQATSRDALLSRIVTFVQTGWPSQPVSDDVRPYFVHRDELSVQDGVLLWGLRVIVPSSLRTQVLELIHESHPGATRGKQLARGYVWWPNIDADIEHAVQSCESCAEQRREPSTPVLGRWEYPTSAFNRVHVDHAGPFLGTYWLVWVDAFSKYAGVHRVKRPDAELTVKALREVFALFGLPNQVVSDNGPAFIADQFQEFLRSNGVKHVRSAPYHPQTNGEAERFVQTFKRAMKGDDQNVSSDALDLRLQKFLLKYRVTPHATTGRSPCELFLNRKPTTLLDRLRPDLRVDVENRVQTQQRQRREKGREPDFVVGDRVYARFWYGQRLWRKGTVVAVAGPLSYDIQVGAELHRRHASQLLHDRVPVDFEEEERGLNELPAAMDEHVNEPIAAPQPRAPPVAPPVGLVAPAPLSPPAAVTVALPQTRPPALPVVEAKPPPTAPPVGKPKQQPPPRPPSSRTSRAPIRFDEEFSELGSSKKH